MTGAPGTIRINDVGTAFVPVADQDRALAFYVSTLGFEKRGDFAYCSMRSSRHDLPGHPHRVGASACRWPRVTELAAKAVQPWPD
jgi:catechol 2,3-dioxygenase-like lactoylglutathione lyase family enzyme